MGGVILDGRTISWTNVTSVVFNGTSVGWLDYNNNTQTITGTPNSVDETVTVAFIVSDVFGGVVQQVVNISVYSGLFTSTLQNVNATYNEEFTYQFNQSEFTSGVNLNVNFNALNEGTNWLSYNPNTMTISGKPSKGSSPVNVTVTAVKNGENNNAKRSLTRLIKRSLTRLVKKSIIREEANSVVPASETQYFVVTPAPATTTDNSGNNNNPTTTNTPSSSNSKKTLAIILGVLLPLLFLLILACILLACYRRRQRDHPHHQKGSLRSQTPPHPNNISNPYAVSPSNEPWPVLDEKAWDEPRRLSALGMFKPVDEKGLLGYETDILDPRLRQATGEEEYSPNGVSRRAPQIPFPEAITRDSATMDPTRQSWQRNTMSSNNWDALGIRHKGKPGERSTMASMDSVSTDELFSVRLVNSPNPVAVRAGAGEMGATAGLTGARAYPQTSNYNHTGGGGISRNVMNVERAPSNDSIGSYSLSSSGYSPPHDSSSDATRRVGDLSLSSNNLSVINHNDTKGLSQSRSPLAPVDNNLLGRAGRALRGVLNRKNSAERNPMQSKNSFGHASSESGELAFM